MPNPARVDPVSIAARRAEAHALDAVTAEEAERIASIATPEEAFDELEKCAVQRLAHLHAAWREIGGLKADIRVLEREKADRDEIIANAAARQDEADTLYARLQHDHALTRGRLRGTRHEASRLRETFQAIAEAREAAGKPVPVCEECEGTGSDMEQIGAAIGSEFDCCDAAGRVDAFRDITGNSPDDCEAKGCVSGRYFGPEVF